MNNIRSNCYFHDEDNDMGARIPICMYFGKYGYCPCSSDCENFADKQEVRAMVKNMVNLRKEKK